MTDTAGRDSFSTDRNSITQNMKIRITAVLAFLTMALLTGCGGNRNNGSVMQNNEEKTVPENNLVGAYGEQRELTEQEMEMFRSLTDGGDVVYTPLSVSTQVVAGTNYRFWCRFEGASDYGHCWVTVFKPLPGQGDPTVTSTVKE